MKLINGKLDEIMKKKGCDASNMFDEEVLPTELEHSDDEEEKEQKRLRKQRLKNKRRHGEMNSGSEDLEDGEMPNEERS